MRRARRPWTKPGLRLDRHVEEITRPSRNGHRRSPASTPSACRQCPPNRSRCPRQPSPCRSRSPRVPPARFRTRSRDPDGCRRLVRRIKGARGLREHVPRGYPCVFEGSRCLWGRGLDVAPHGRGAGTVRARDDRRPWLLAAARFAARSPAGQRTPKEDRHPSPHGSQAHGNVARAPPNAALTPESPTTAGSLRPPPIKRRCADPRGAATLLEDRGPRCHVASPWPAQLTRVITYPAFMCHVDSTNWGPNHARNVTS